MSMSKVPPLCICGFIGGNGHKCPRTDTKGPGRPPKPDSERLQSITIRLHPDMVRRLDAIGERSTVIRDILRCTLK